MCLDDLRHFLQTGHVMFPPSFWSLEAKKSEAGSLMDPKGAKSRPRWSLLETSRVEVWVFLSFAISSVLWFAMVVVIYPEQVGRLRAYDTLARRC